MDTTQSLSSTRERRWDIRTIPLPPLLPPSPNELPVLSGVFLFALSSSLLAAVTCYGVVVVEAACTQLYNALYMNAPP